MAGPYASLNGRRVISGSVMFPFYGAWMADVVLSASDTIPTQTQLVVGDLTLTCAVYRQLSSAGSRSARVVAGFGGWRKTIAAQAYSNPSGLNVSLLLGDAARLVGEKVSIAQDQSVGSLFVREAAPASRVLRQLAGALWWIDANGVTQVGPRASSPITTAFTAVEWSGGKGRFDIATESLSDWMPARTFTSATIATSQTIGETSIAIDNDGKVRLSVLSTP